MRLATACCVIFGLASAATLAVPAAAQDPGTPSWHIVSSREEGFSVDAPAPQKPNAARPRSYAFVMEDSSFMVEVSNLNDGIRRAVLKGDRALVDRILNTVRDETTHTLNATVSSSSLADFGGRPSILFAYSGTAGPGAFVATERVVIADDRIYEVTAIGSAGKLPKTDSDRFLTSFRIVGATPPIATPFGPFKTISFSQSVCDKIPSIGVSFEVPEEFAGRSPTPSLESGCLWGTQADLDHVTADPSGGDFTGLRNGVFRARISTNVSNSPDTGIFDALDGQGEAGIRREMEQTGVKVVIWKKETLAGLPALQIVADVPGNDRVYMLYLGNTRFVSNAMLLNYYHPARRSSADDRLWARFIEGLRPAR